MKFTLIRFTVLPVIVLSLFLHPCFAEAESAEADSGRAIQPTEIPGPWEWSPQPLPPIEGVVARDAQERPVYGLYCWADEYLQHRDFIKETGWKNLRLSGPITDEFMHAAVEDGMEVMFTMPAREPFREEGQKHGIWRNRANFDSDEAFIADYVADIEDVLKRYGPGGTFFAENPELPERPLELIEIFNEPNFWYLDTAREDKTNHFPPKDPAARDAQNASRQALYAKLLVAAHKKIKEVAPRVRVVGFAAGGASGADVPFIRGVLAADPATAGAFDILSTHPYVRPAPPDAALKKSWGPVSIATGTAQIRETMAAQNVADRPLWWTELNWTIFPEAGGKFDEKKIRNVARDTTPELQAAYTVRTYALAMRLGVDRLHFMSLVDTDSVNSGMRNPGGSPRPVATAVRTMIDLMPNPKLLGAVTENTTGQTIYRFDPDHTTPGDTEVWMAWKVQGPESVKIAVPGDSVTEVDMLGNRREVPVTDGHIETEIGPLPVYWLIDSSKSN